MRDGRGVHAGSEAAGDGDVDRGGPGRWVVSADVSRGDRGRGAGEGSLAL